MKIVGIIFPHQLFEENPLFSTCKTVYLVEEHLYFKQYNFHRQKIAFHRASMKFYENNLQSKKIKVEYIDSHNELSDTRKLIPYLSAQGVKSVSFIDSTDHWLENRIHKASKESNIDLNKIPSPLFLNSSEEVGEYFKGRKRMFQTDFYKHQRISRNILLDKEQKPIGGKWTYDDENRLKYPKDKTPPKLEPLKLNQFHKEAINYTNDYFRNNYGVLNKEFNYPTTHGESKDWLANFLRTRFAEFGDYEDAIVSEELILHHSVLTPMLNVGLLTPKYILEETLK